MEWGDHTAGRWSDCTILRPPQRCQRLRCVVINLYGFNLLVPNDWWCGTSFCEYLPSFPVSSLAKRLFTFSPFFYWAFVSFLSSFDRIPLLDRICKHLSLSQVSLFSQQLFGMEWNGVQFYVFSFVDQEKNQEFISVWVGFWTLYFISLTVFCELYHTVLITITLWQALKSSKWYSSYKYWLFNKHPKTIHKWW